MCYSSLGSIILEENELDKRLELEHDAYDWMQTRRLQIQWDSRHISLRFLHCLCSFADGTRRCCCVAFLVYWSLGLLASWPLAALLFRVTPTVSILPCQSYRVTPPVMLVLRSGNARLGDTLPEGTSGTLRLPARAWQLTVHDAHVVYDLLARAGVST